MRISSADGSTVAEFVPGAGMLCSSLLVNGVERLDQRGGLEAYATHGSTMGIPLLYPWANRLSGREFEVAGETVRLPHDRHVIHEDGTGTPIHGLIPELLSFKATADGDRIAATLHWKRPEQLERYPFAHRLELEANVGAGTLTITTTIEAEDRVPVSFGFHPYLRLTGAPRAAWTVALPPCDSLTLDERMIPTGERTALATNAFSLAEHEFDDGYELLDRSSARFEARSADAGRITLELLEGYGFAQVYSPAGAEFVCFEPMTAPTNALISGDGLRVLGPGESHRARFALRFAR